ncbi:MAG: hypothetical protein GY754_17045, partial [bacterium]|nr:hypothetical protein [bacterium]
MGEFFNQIPESIKPHIKDITKSSGLDSTDDALELMSEAWLEKNDAFEQEIDSHDMEEVEGLLKDDARGALVMTYSG